MWEKCIHCLIFVRISQILRLDASLWCYTYLLFVYFEFWVGIQNSIPNVWQIIFSNASVQGGLFNLIYMASLMALAMLFPSLPIIWKVSINVVWPLLL